MNSLSWMIYAANSVGSVGFVIGLAGLFVLAAWLISTIHVAVHNGNENYPNLYPNHKRKEHSAKLAIYGFLLVMFSAVIPSNSTIYMIAASEMGEKAMQTEMASDVFEIVKKEIKKMKEAQ